MQHHLYHISIYDGILHNRMTMSHFCWYRLYDVGLILLDIEEYKRMKLLFLWPGRHDQLHNELLCMDRLCIKLLLITFVKIFYKKNKTNLERVQYLVVVPLPHVQLRFLKPLRFRVVNRHSIFRF